MFGGATACAVALGAGAGADAATGTGAVRFEYGGGIGAEAIACAGRAVGGGRAAFPGVLERPRDDGFPDPGVRARATMAGDLPGVVDATRRTLAPGVTGRAVVMARLPDADADDDDDDTAEGWCGVAPASRAAAARVCTTGSACSFTSSYLARRAARSLASAATSARRATASSRPLRRDADSAWLSASAARRAVGVDADERGVVAPEAIETRDSPSASDGVRGAADADGERGTDADRRLSVSRDSVRSYDVRRCRRRSFSASTSSRRGEAWAGGGRCGTVEAARKDAGMMVVDAPCPD